jgi:hypothetical protein
MDEESRLAVLASHRRIRGSGQPATRAITRFAIFIWGSRGRLYCARHVRTSEFWPRARNNGLLPSEMGSRVNYCVLPWVRHKALLWVVNAVILQ